MRVESGFFQASVAYSFSSKQMGLGVFLTCTADSPLPSLQWAFPDAFFFLAEQDSLGLRNLWWLCCKFLG